MESPDCRKRERKINRITYRNPSAADDEKTENKKRESHSSLPATFDGHIQAERMGKTAISWMVDAFNNKVL